MKFKSKLPPLSRGVKERNKAFNNLSPEDQRKEIAFEVIKMIRNGVINREQVGTGYWTSHNLSHVLETSYSPEDFQEKLLEVEGCQVCARGALMLAQIRLGNELEPDARTSTDGNRCNIKGFSIEDFESMETVYEHNITEDEDERAYKYALNAAGFDLHSAYSILNMMYNVLKNGNFDPGDRTIYVDPYTGKEVRS